jgi:catechol 2,3-dioxygenase-like lactoylglutathione lyase family enzyme
MPKSLSHVVVLTNDLDAVVRFLTDVAKITAVAPYETKPEDIQALFGWPIEHGVTRGAFVGEGAGSIDVLEIPPALRESVQPGVRLLAVVNRDAAQGGADAAAAGYEVRGPFTTTAATGVPMSLVEVVAGGIPFELVQFG